MPPTTTEPKPLPELSEFRETIAELAVLLKAMREHLPNDITEDAVSYLERVQDDKAGLRLLRSALVRRG